MEQFQRMEKAYEVLSNAYCVFAREWNIYCTIRKEFKVVEDLNLGDTKSVAKTNTSSTMPPLTPANISKKPVEPNIQITNEISIPPVSILLIWISLLSIIVFKLLIVKIF